MDQVISAQIYGPSVKHAGHKSWSGRKEFDNLQCKPRKGG